MKQALILLISIVVVFVAPGAQGTDHLSFSNVPANVTRIGCGVTQLCVETPEDCDPAGDDPCLFTSIDGTAGRALEGTTLSFQLAGTIDGDGYIAVALAVNASEGNSTVFICARTNTSTTAAFFFRTMKRNNENGMLSSTETNVTEIQNSITNTTIQCAFNVPGVNASRSRSRTADTTFAIILGTGTVNGTTVGNLTPNVTTDPLNVIQPTSNLNNNNNNNTSNALVTRMGCGTTKLCVETPEDCDPATNNTCLFTSINGTAGTPPNGTMLHFELSGTTSGDNYIAVALTANASEGTAMLYVCGRNGTTNGTGGTFFFLTAQRNNTSGALTVMNGMARGIRYLTTDIRIQCVFYVPGVNASRSRTADTTFSIILGTGTVNGSTLGNFTVAVTTSPLNVLDPTSNLNNNPTTASPPTTMSGANRTLFPQALPLLLSIFILSILKTA